MARISGLEKSKYVRVGSETECYYCGAPAGLDDLTPSSSATTLFKEQFLGQWTVTRVCRKCWGKIYTANIANAGLKFGVQAGCMTVDQKKALISGAPSLKAESLRFSPSYGLVLPDGFFKADEEHYIYDSKTYYRAEILALQAPLCTKLIGLSREIIEVAFASAMASGSLEIDRENEYRAMLGINETAQESQGW